MTATSSGPRKQPIPFGKYLLLDRINIGGMAEVWRGKSFGAGGFERLVAIKRILPNIAEDEEFITMFIDEAKISSQLTHANIAQIYELGQISQSYFIALEYIPGKDMRAIFDRSRKNGEIAPIPLTCFIVTRMCEGLDYAHRKKDGMGRELNIVHRDVSPQNVLISYEGEVKVIDFGIAKAANKATKTQAGILKGKFGYMSPEQIRGINVDRRSDIFAIGVCLYEMLTGERLFVGDSDFAVLEKVRKAEVPPPSTLNPLVPEALDRIVLKALTRDVEQRYAFASELGDELQRFLITSQAMFSRKDLVAYMKETFPEDVERERLRLQEYSAIEIPEGMRAAIERGFGAMPALTTAPGASLVSTTPDAPVAPDPTALRPAAPTRSPPGGIRRSPSLTALPKLSLPTPPPQPAQAPAALLPVPTNEGDEDEGATTLIDPSELGLSPDELLRPGVPPLPPIPASPAQIAHPEDDEGAYDKTSVPLTPSEVDAPRVAPPLAPMNPRRLMDDPGAGPRSTAVQRPRPPRASEPLQQFSGPDESTNPDQTNPSRERTDEFNSRSLLDSSSDEATQFSPEDSSDLTPTGPLSAALSRTADAPRRQQLEEARPIGARPYVPPPQVATVSKPGLLAGINRAKLLVVGAVVGAVLLIVFAAVLSTSQRDLGYVYIDVQPRPPASSVRVNVGGQDLEGVSWPILRQVEVGSTVVMIAAEGFETVMQPVTVKEGSEPTKVNLELKKAGEGPAAVQNTP